MLLLDIDNGGDSLVQGFVRCQWPTNEHIRNNQSSTWERLFVRSAMLWNPLQPVSAAIRVAASPDQPIETVHSLVVPKAHEGRLRLMLAAFLRSDNIGGAQADTPQHREDLNQRYVHPDEQRIAIHHDTLRTHEGFNIHHNFRLAHYLPSLIASFVDLGLSVSYEAQVIPWTPPREAIRKVLYGASYLEDSLSAPDELVKDQFALFERLKRAAQLSTAYHVEECLCCPPDQNINTLEEVLSVALSNTIYAGLGAPPRLVALEEYRNEAFGYHVHSALMNDSIELAAQEIADIALKDDVDDLLSAKVLGLQSVLHNSQTSLTEPLFATLTQPGLRSIARTGKMTTSPSIDQPFIFISYARADAAIVNPLVEQLTNRGIAIWIDRQIIGGDDWVSALEAKLIHSSGVLALMSPAFVDSKYCSREIRFADALNKPIIPIQLHPVELSGGLNFILHSIQQIKLNQQASHEAIVCAIRKHAPDTLSEPS